MATYTSSMQQRQQWAAAMVKHYRLASHASAQYRTLPALLNQLLRAGLITQAVHDDTLQQPQEKPQTVLAPVAAHVTVAPSIMWGNGSSGLMQHDEHQYQAAHYELVREYKAAGMAGHGVCSNWKLATLQTKLANRYACTCNKPTGYCPEHGTK